MDGCVGIKANEGCHYIDEESRPAVGPIGPPNAQLLHNVTETIGDAPLSQEIKQAIRADLLNRYNSETEENIPPLWNCLLHRGEWNPAEG